MEVYNEALVWSIITYDEASAVNKNLGVKSILLKCSGTRSQ